jgi:hypothetical protein
MQIRGLHFWEMEKLLGPNAYHNVHKILLSIHVYLFTAQNVSYCGKVKKTLQRPECDIINYWRS